MCLNCGNWYCNFCFLGFSSEGAEAARANAHTHVASHHNRADNRDAFLPPEVVAAGQRQLQQRMLVKCVALARTSKDFGENGCSCSSDAQLGLILAAEDLAALNLNVVEIWNEAGAEVGAEALPSSPHSATPPLAVCDGGLQLAAALKTQNLLACRQIMQAFKNNLNCNYIDEESGHPLVSLALLLRQKSIVVQLLRRGADPLLHSEKVRRTVLYIAIETGMLDIVKLILELNPTIDLNSCITEEANGYHPLQAAARYNHGHIVKFLVSRGADIHKKELELGYTPILLALVLAHSWAARELILLGSSLNEPGTAGRTALFILAEKVCLLN
jgi:ankyrin repeat protein